MSIKFIQAIKTNNKHKNLFKVEIADADQSVYIRFFSQKSSVKYKMAPCDLSPTETNIQFIEAKTTEFTIENSQSLKISYHYSGEVHLQRYHNNPNKRNYISEDLAAVNLSKLDNNLNHIVTITVNNLDFFPDHKNEKQSKIECLDLTENDTNFDSFVITVFVSKKDFYIDKEEQEMLRKIGCFKIFWDDDLKDKTKLVYCYLMIRPKIEKITSDLCLYLGWDENIRNTSIDNKMLFVQTI